METGLSKAAARVQEALAELGARCEVVELPGSTRTAQEAADTIGCGVGQIVKSLIFQGKNSLAPYLVLVSGDNLADEKKLRGFTGEKFRRAAPEFVREVSGFAIGGVPPVGHLQKMTTFIDEDLMRYEVVWAAAGTPHAVFACSPDDLLAVTRGQVVNLKREA
ncbi:MAG: YbaK/EbsC family protein [Anaerolineaceae bacterium]|nr:YbaK/EbsC family protein [Anaerolineaceae bacterium]